MSLLILPDDTLKIECHAGGSIYTEVQLQLIHSFDIPQSQYKQFCHNSSIWQSTIEQDFFWYAFN